MADWLMSCGQERWLDLGRWLMDRLHERWAPVRLVGSPAHYLVNRLNDAFTITVMNHQTSPWRGTSSGKSAHRSRHTATKPMIPPVPTSFMNPRSARTVIWFAPSRRASLMFQLPGTM